MRAAPVVQVARELLAKCADARRAAENKAYFKSPFLFLGVTKEDINGVGRKLKGEVRAGGRTGILRVLGELWGSGVHEEMSLAVVLAALCVDQMGPADVTNVFAEWLDGCQTWDHLDELCIRVIGILALSHPELWPMIEEWSQAPHMWKRRASLISHLPAVRAGSVRADQVERTCRGLAHETDFFIRKAIGWVLRELSDEDRATMVRVFRSVGGRLSGLSRREATRKLPVSERKALLASVVQEEPS